MCGCVSSALRGWNTIFVVKQTGLFHYHSFLHNKGCCGIKCRIKSCCTQSNVIHADEALFCSQIRTVFPFWDNPASSLQRLSYQLGLYPNLSFTMWRFIPGGKKQFRMFQGWIKSCETHGGWLRQLILSLENEEKAVLCFWSMPLKRLKHKSSLLALKVW